MSRLTHPVIDLDGCTPRWAAETPARSFDRAYILGGTDPFALQVLTTASGSLADQFAVVGRQFTNRRFNSSTANTEVNGQLARSAFGEAGSARERWGDLIWRLPDGSEAYLRTSTMTQAEVVALATSLQPRPADASIPGFDTTDDSFIVMDETMTPFDVGPTIDSACEFTAGGWLRVSILPGTSVGDAIFLTDRPFETRGATQQLDDQRIVTVSGRDDVSQRSAEALATVRHADDNEWQHLTQADPTDFEPNQPPP